MFSLTYQLVWIFYRANKHQTRSSVWVSHWSVCFRLCGLYMTQVSSLNCTLLMGSDWVYALETNTKYIVTELNSFICWCSVELASAHGFLCSLVKSDMRAVLICEQALEQILDQISVQIYRIKSVQWLSKWETKSTLPYTEGQSYEH